MYMYCIHLRRYRSHDTRTNLSEGLAEVASIEFRYRNEVMKPLGLEGSSFEEFVSVTQKDQQFYVDEPEALKLLYEERCKVRCEEY